MENIENRDLDLAPNDLHELYGSVLAAHEGGQELVPTPNGEMRGIAGAARLLVERMERGLLGFNMPEKDQHLIVQLLINDIFSGAMQTMDGPEALDVKERALRTKIALLEFYGAPDELIEEIIKKAQAVLELELRVL